MTTTTINGGSGNDVLIGNNKNNTINGNNGNDILIGGNGKDTLKDFASSQDILHFNGLSHMDANTVIQNVNATISGFVDDGANHLKVDFTSGGSITFGTVDFSSLSAEQVAAHDISTVVATEAQIHVVYI